MSHDANFGPSMYPGRHQAGVRITNWTKPNRITAVYLALSLIWLLLVCGEAGIPGFSKWSIGLGILFAMASGSLMYWVSRREFAPFICGLEESPANSEGQINSSRFEHEELPHLILANMSQGVFWTDRNFQILGCNRAFAELLGLVDPKSLYGTTVNALPLLRTTDARRIERRVREVTQSRTAQHHGVEQWTIRGGNAAWINTSTVPILSQQNQVVGTIGFWEDLTDHRQSKLDWHTSEEALRLFIEHAPASVAMLDREMRYLHVSKRWYHDYALAANDVIGECHYDVFPGIPDRWKAIHQRCLAGAVECSEEDRIKLHNGSIEWIRWEIHPWTRIDGEIGGIAIFSENITARKESRIEHRKLAKIIEHSRDLIAIAELDGTVTFMNSGGRKMLGLDETGDLLNLHFTDYVPAEWKEFFLDTVVRTAGEHGIWEGEMQLLHTKTGALIDVFRAVFLISEETGKSWFATVTRDVTELKRTEKTIRDNEERLRRLVDVLPGALYVHNGKEILFCNQAFIRLMGATSTEELLGKSPFIVAHPDYHAAIRKRIAVGQMTGKFAPEMEMLAVRLDGHIFPAQVVGASITGYGPSAFVVAINDLTERDRTFGLLRSVMESVNDAIITIDVEGTIHSANPATERMFDYPMQELLGKNVRMLMPEPFRSKSDQFLSKSANPGTAKPIGIGREVQGRRNDGSTFPVELSVTEFQLDRERHFTGVIRDITARKRLETQFQQAQKMEAVGRLAGGVAHDFNNLLTVISGYGQLLFKDLPTTGSQRECITAILDAGERATNLTRQLLSFSRKAVIEPQPIDLNIVVDKAVGMLRRLIEEDIVLRVELHAARARIKAAPGGLEQALMNLVVNARDAMPNGGQLQIKTNNMTPRQFDEPEVHQLPPGEYIELTVSDTGQGMSDDIKSKIFEPFFTTKDVGKGSGLGLSVVHGIIKQCGGSIQVDSHIGVGTTFRFLFPLTMDDSHIPETAPTGESIRGHETVLLVEDSPPVRKIARIALEANGYHVLEASGGHEAAHVSADYPDAIQLLLTDVVMPEVGGLKLADALRAQRPDLRVLFMTGYTDDAVLQRGVSNSHENLLQKPFTAVGLAKKVRAVLDAAK